MHLSIHTYLMSRWVARPWDSLWFGDASPQVDGPVVGATTDRMYLLSPTMMFFQVGGDCGGHVPRLDRRDAWGGQHGSTASRVVPAMKATN